MQHQNISPFFPRAKVLKRNGGHELEVQASSADQTVNLDAITELLEFGEVFVNDLGDGLEGFGGSLIAVVLASPLSTDAVEGHGTIGQWDVLGVEGHVLARRNGEGSKCL